MSGEPIGSDLSSSHTHAPLPADAPRRALVLFFILATAAIFVTLFAVLYYRWSGAEEPSSVIVVATTPAFEGAEITVTGGTLPKPYVVKVPDRSSRSLPFYVDPGVYTITVSRDGKTIYTFSDNLLPRGKMLPVSLEEIEHLLPPSPATATSAATPRS
jgi:hypothetical protein